MTKRENEVLFAGNPITILGPAIRVGQFAPDFELTGIDLCHKTLADFDGKIKVISVVPSLDTGVCDAATHWFNKNVTGMGDDVVVITVSMDLPFAQKRWCGAAGNTKVVTLSDYQTAAFGEDYGFLIEGLRLLTRGVLVLDKNNRVVHVEYSKEVTEQIDFDAVLAAVAELHA